MENARSAKVVDILPRGDREDRGMGTNRFAGFVRERRKVRFHAGFIAIPVSVRTRHRASSHKPADAPSTKSSSLIIGIEHDDALHLLTRKKTVIRFRGTTGLDGIASSVSEPPASGATRRRQRSFAGRGSRLRCFRIHGPVAARPRVFPYPLRPASRGADPCRVRLPSCVQPGQLKQVQ